jgi:chromatin remodeling complex protein RSC6
MAKKTATKNTTETAKVAVPAPVTEKKSKKAAAPVAEPAPETTTAAPETTTAAPETTTTETDALVAQSSEFVAKLQQLNSMISALKTEYKTLERKWSRELKQAQKISAKRKRKAGARQPSGFVKPTKISDELATFLGKDKGSEMARTEVTREINQYIRAHSLQDKANGRNIIPDSKLTSLLKLQKGDELTYFNLQKYMSPHFAKAVKAIPA